jgi:hypothetical protein
MQSGDAMLQKDTKDGFIYLILEDGELPINQQLAKQIIQHPTVYQERWREGWTETKDTGKVRWRIE